MPLDLQGQLLKFLVEKTVMRHGSKKQLDANTRVISATNINLSEKIKSKKFREDLFHRLNVVPIKIPSLNGAPLALGLSWSYKSHSSARKGR